MSRTDIFVRLAAVVVAGLSMAIGGCGSGGSHPSIEVVRDASLSDQSIEVDVIGADPDAIAKYTTADVGRYFASKSATRSGAPKHTMKFSAGGADAQTLSGSDPVWKKWEKANSVVLLANIAGMTSKGTADPRRTVVPLAGVTYEDNTVKVRMSEEGLVVVPPEKPKY